MKLGVFVSDYTLKNDTLDRLASADTTLIFVQNGVYHASIKGSALLGKTSKLYALSEDLATRGIAASDVDAKVKVVTYGDVVDLIFKDIEKIAYM